MVPSSFVKNGLKSYYCIVVLSVPGVPETERSCLNVFNLLPRVQDLAKEVPPIMNVLNIHENLLECLLEMGNYADVQASVPDPDPPDLHVFGPPGSGSTSQRYGSGSGS
jgi:hypothetical protein